MNKLFLLMMLPTLAWGGNGFLGMDDGSEAHQSVEGVPVAWYRVGSDANGLNVQIEPPHGLFDPGRSVPLLAFRCGTGQRETVVFGEWGPRWVVCSLTERGCK